MAHQTKIKPPPSLKHKIININLGSTTQSNVCCRSIESWCLKLFYVQKSWSICNFNTGKFEICKSATPFLHFRDEIFWVSHLILLINDDHQDKKFKEYNKDDQRFFENAKWFAERVL